MPPIHRVRQQVDKRGTQVSQVMTSMALSRNEQFWRLVPVLAELDMGTIFYRLTSPGFCGGFQFLFLTPLDEMTLER